MKTRTIYQVEVVEPQRDAGPLDEQALANDLAASILDGWGFPEGVEVEARFVRRENVAGTEPVKPPVKLSPPDDAEGR